MPKRHEPYRSRLAELRTIFRQIPALSISERFQSCTPTYDGASLRRDMDQKDFDIYGITVGRVVGYVERQDLEAGPCNRWQRRFQPNDLLPAKTPLVDVLPLLRDRPWLIFVERRRIARIVSRGDLQKIPVRLFAFAVVSLIEAHLERLIRETYAHEAWQDRLGPARLQKAKSTFKSLRGNGAGIDLLTCLQFCDKREVFVRTPGLLVKARANKNAMTKKLEQAEKLRNLLAHGQDLVSGSSWREVLGDLEDNERLLECLEGCG
jgi:hypothetical protein